MDRTTHETIRFWAKVAILPVLYLIAFVLALLLEINSAYRTVVKNLIRGRKWKKASLPRLARNPVVKAVVIPLLIIGVFAIAGFEAWKERREKTWEEKRRKCNTSEHDDESIFDHSDSSESSGPEGHDE